MPVQSEHKRLPVVAPTGNQVQSQSSSLFLNGETPVFKRVTIQIPTLINGINDNDTLISLRLKRDEFEDFLNNANEKTYKTFDTKCIKCVRKTVLDYKNKQYCISCVKKIIKPKLNKLYREIQELEDPIPCDTTVIQNIINIIDNSDFLVDYKNINDTTIANTIIINYINDNIFVLEKNKYNKTFYEWNTTSLLWLETSGDKLKNKYMDKISVTVDQVRDKLFEYIGNERFKFYNSELEPDIIVKDPECKDKVRRYLKSHNFIEDYYNHIAKLSKRLGNSSSKQNIWREVIPHLIRADITDENLNPPGNLVPVKNGLLLNFCTGEVTERTKSHLYTKTWDVDYLVDINTQGAEEYLFQLSCENKEVYEITLVLTAVYISGTSSKTMCFFIGSGNNGKTKYIECICKILGHYHVIVDNRSITVNGNKACHDSDLIKLKGRQLCVITEISKTLTLDCMNCKKLSGSDTISARPAGQADYVTFSSSYLHFLGAGNDMAKYNNIDQAFFKRLFVLPFHARFLGTQKMVDEQNNKPQVEGISEDDILKQLPPKYYVADAKIEEKLFSDEFKSKLFKLLFLRSVKYYTEKQCLISLIPDWLKANSDFVVKDSDNLSSLVSDFVREFIIDGDKCSRTLLYNSFKKWCSWREIFIPLGSKEYSDAKFYSALRLLYGDERKSNGERVFYGIKLSSKFDEMVAAKTVEAAKKSKEKEDNEKKFNDKAIEQAVIDAQNSTKKYINPPLYPGLKF